MTRALIIDHDDQIVQRISALIKEYFPNTRLVGVAGSVSAAVPLVIKEKPDLVLMEWDLPDGNGTELLQQLGKTTFQLVILSSKNRLSFNTDAHPVFGFLLKPFDDTTALKTLIQVRIALEKQQACKINDSVGSPPCLTSRIKITNHNNIRYVHPDDIIYCSSDAGYTHVFLKNSTQLMVSKNLKTFEQTLAPHLFYRIHHAYLINTQYIKEFCKTNGFKVILDDGTQLPVSVRKKPGLLRMMEQN